MAHPLLMSALQDGGVELREGELRAKGRKRKEGGEEEGEGGEGGEGRQPVAHTSKTSWCSTSPALCMDGAELQQQHKLSTHLVLFSPQLPKN